MHGHMPCRDDQPTTGDHSAPGLSVADIFRSHGDAYRRARSPNTEQHRVMRAIEQCRTSALGGHLDVCDRCGYQRPSYNSCRNRHCPTCQCVAQARWIEQRIDRLVPTHYFHVVFTLPAELRALALANRRRIFTMLFRAASQTLSCLAADPRRLGALLGITAVLHTWTRALHFHPHLHCVVTGGGLSPDACRWVPTKSPTYLFPVRVLSSLFRAKFLRALRSAFRQGTLEFSGRTAALAAPSQFDRFIDRLYRQDWIVYAKRPFGGPEQVFRYLGRYTHRVAISNQRLQAVDPHNVRFRTRGDQTVTLHPVEFIRRFLLHVLPAGFVKSATMACSLQPTSPPSSGRPPLSCATSTHTIPQITLRTLRCPTPIGGPNLSLWAVSISCAARVASVAPCSATRCPIICCRPRTTSHRPMLSLNRTPPPSCGPPARPAAPRPLAAFLPLRTRRRPLDALRRTPRPSRIISLRAKLLRLPLSPQPQRPPFLP